MATRSETPNEVGDEVANIGMGSGELMERFQNLQGNARLAAANTNEILGASAFGSPNEFGTPMTGRYGTPGDENNYLASSGKDLDKLLDFQQLMKTRAQDLLLLDDWDDLLSANIKARHLGPMKKLTPVKDFSETALELFLTEYAYHLSEGGCSRWSFAFDVDSVEALAVYLSLDVEKVAKLSAQALRVALLEVRAHLPIQDWQREMAGFELNDQMDLAAVIKVLVSAKKLWRRRRRAVDETAAIRELKDRLIAKCEFLRDHLHPVNFNGSFDNLQRCIVDRWRELEAFRGRGKMTSDILRGNDAHVAAATVVEQPVAAIGVQPPQDEYEKRKRDDKVVKCYRCGRDGHSLWKCTSRHVLDGFDDDKFTARKREYAEKWKHI